MFNSKEVKQMADSLRNFAENIKLAKRIKCAKMVVGATAIKQLESKMIRHGLIKEK